MWGDQTWEEMAVVFLDVATEIKSKSASTENTAQSIPAAMSVADCSTIQQTKMSLPLKQFDSRMIS